MAWLGSHKVDQVLQDERVYILDTGQKVHFEHLKPHQCGLTEFVTTPLDTGEAEVIKDPEPECSTEAIDIEFFQPIEFRGFGCVFAFA